MLPGKMCSANRCKREVLPTAWKTKSNILPIKEKWLVKEEKKRELTAVANENYFVQNVVILDRIGETQTHLIILIE